MSEPTLSQVATGLGALSVRFDALEASLKEIKQLLRDHSQEMKEATAGLSEKTNQQEVRLSIVEKQLEESRARGQKLASDVEQNKLGMAKVSAIAVAASLVITVGAELVGSQVLQPQHSHETATAHRLNSWNNTKANSRSRIPRTIPGINRPQSQPQVAQT